MKTCLLAILLIFSTSVLSQDLLISQATLHVGDGSTVIENTDILITDGRIAKSRLAFPPIK